jgi:hypothetical protein
VLTCDLGDSFYITLFWICTGPPPLFSDIYRPLPSPTPPVPSAAVVQASRDHRPLLLDIFLPTSVGHFACPVRCLRYNFHRIISSSLLVLLFYSKIYWISYEPSTALRYNMNNSGVPPRPHITAEGTHVLVSPNSSRIIELPHHLSKIDLCTDYPDPSEATTLRWSMNPYPQLAYCLTSPRFQGPLLQRLAYTRRTLPVIWDGRIHFWGLSPDVLYLWWSLEMCLICVARELFSSTTALHSQTFQVPSDYGYCRPHGKRDRAVRCSMRAHDAFVPLMALVSYAISLTPSFTDENPPWVAKLIERGIHPEWVEMLKTSQLADFSEANQRVGVIIHPNCNFLNRISCMVRANVPVWILWDDPAHYSTEWFYKEYCPIAAEVREARTDAQWRQAARETMEALSNRAIQRDDATSDVTLVPDDSTLVANVAPSPPQNEPPMPDSFSGQRRGETMDQFFERRRARNALIETNERPGDRIARLARMEAAERHSRPG